MAASPGSVHWSASSRASSFASFDHITDERDFDELASMIPDSQPNNATMLSNPPPKKFSALADKISPAALLEGFSWAVKQPPRPGQFCRPPHHEPPQLAGSSTHFRQPPIVGRELAPSLPGQITLPGIRRDVAILDLPEIGLPGKKPPIERLSAESGVSQSLSTNEEPLSQEVSTETVSSQLTKPPRDPPIPDHDGTQGQSGGISPRGKHHEGPSRQQSSMQNPSFSSQPPTPSRSTNLPEFKRTIPSSTNHDGQKLDELKLPLPREKRVHRTTHRDPPSSICGDLERPTPQTPRSQHRRQREVRSQMPSRPILTPRPHGKAPENHDRSQSRTSNISKKRSTGQKRRARAAPERRKEAMHHVAQYWNECMRISEDEKQEAAWEIERLQTEISQREKELDKSFGLLSKKEIEIKGARKRCQELEHQENQATGENHRLNGEIKSLQEQLEASQKHAEGLKDKYRTCRSKLNEAISEQQALFQRSRELYRATRKELEEEKSSRVADSLAVDNAIEIGRKKREEMRICLDELRTQAEREGHRKDRIVSELEAKLQQQEAELIHERDSAIELRQQIEDQKKIQDSVTRVESQVQALLEKSTNSDTCGRNQREITDQLSSKLDLVIKHLDSFKDNAVTPLAIEPVIKRLEKNIVSRILPAILTVISGQAQADKSGVGFRDDVLVRLEQIQSGLIHQDERMSQDRQNDEAIRRELFDVLGRIDTRTFNIDKTYKQTERHFVEWTQGYTRQQEALEASLQDRITQQFRDRESVIGMLEQQLQSVAEDYGKKIETMKQLILQSDGEAKKYLQETIAAIRNTLENGFKEGSARSERELSQSEGIRVMLDSHLKEVKDQLMTTSHNDPNSGALYQALNKEQKAVGELRQKLAVLEQEATTNKGLHERWQKDIKTIDVLRDQLKDISERVPQMESLEVEFRSMAEISRLMNSTAGYLVAERSWVSQQLGANPEPEVLGFGAEGMLHPSQAENWGKGESIASSNPQSMITNLSSLADLWDPATGASSQDENVNRKVVFNSPGGRSSPFPPPSIEQEQLRRREAAAPRSILRSSASSSQDSAQDSQLSRIPPNQSQYNRPVTGKASSTTASAKQGMMEQIQTKFIQPRPTQKNWDLPTVADFEKNIQPSRSEGGMAEKKHSLVSTEQVHSPNGKKMKVEEGSSQTMQNLKDYRPQARASKRQAVIRTYSRKPIGE